MWTAEEFDCEVRDSVKGVVAGCSAKGVYPDLENGEGAFSSFGALSRGTEVFCTILRKPTDRFLALVSIDSVMDAEVRAA